MRADQIEELKDRLEDYRRQIIMRLEVMQSEQQSTVLWKLHSLCEANSRLHADMAYQILNLRSLILDAVAQAKDELQRQDFQTIIGRQVGTDFFVVKSMADREPQETGPLVRTLAESAVIGGNIGLALQLLRALRFNSMRFRYSKIPTAHLNTCQWMFDNDFSQWLASSHPVFWISGKPGSGKSTLMKFLVDNMDVSKCLVAWANGSRIIAANYFFWTNGTEMQKSQEGLLRSLLYDLLRQNPNAIQATFPQQWQWLESGYAEEDLPPWSRQDLLGGLSRLLHDKISSAKYLIFVDGLDEYEGEHESLVRVLHGFTRMSNVKICVASRPWNVFEAAFGDNVAHKLYLEEFNRADIARYVRDNLEVNPDFERIRVRDPEAEPLLLEIISRAQGVFLWVYLVVRSLVRGLQNRDRITDLQRRLRDFPSDLDDFFSHILLSLDQTYRVQAARNFQVALAAPRPLSLLNYWYVDVEEVDHLFLSNLLVLTLNSGELRARQEEMHKRLNGRCKGLLEVTRIPNLDSPYDCRVDFLHRTVKDFLRTKDIQQQLLKWSTLSFLRCDSGLSRHYHATPEPFNPHLTLCKSTLAELKSAPVKYGYLRGPGPMLDLVNDLFFCAQRYELTMGKSLTELLGVLQSIINIHTTNYPTQQPSYPWANWHSEDILTHAVKWNLLLHVKAAIALGLISTTEKTRLLIAGLTGRFGRNGDITLGPDQQMIETILERGPTVTFDALALKYVIASLQNCPVDGLYGCLLLLAIHRALKVKADADVWNELASILSNEEITTLRRTQKAVVRESRNPLRWFFRRKK